MSSLESMGASKLRVRTSPIRGLEATAPIAKGEVVARVPRGQVLRVLEVERSWNCQLAAALLEAERSGKYAAWIESLPRAYDDLPVNWGDVDVYYEPLASALRRDKEKFQAAVATLTRQGYDEARAKWALATVRTRSFAGPAEATEPRNRLFLALFVVWLAVGYVALGGNVENAASGVACAAVAAVVSDVASAREFDEARQIVLAPGLDLANHRSGAPAVEYEYFRDAYALAANADIKVGDEVYTSYGDKPNADLLLNYGFVEAENAHDTYVFPPDHPTCPSVVVGLDGPRPANLDAAALDRICREEAARILAATQPATSADPPSVLLLAQLAEHHAALLRRFAGGSL